MKKIALSISVVCLSLVALSQTSFTPFTGTWEEAKQVAASQNKYIFLDFYADWCVTCKQMDNSVFKDEIIVRNIAEHFIFYKIDIDRFNGMDLAAEYNVTMLPTYVVTTEHGVEKLRVKGSTTIDKMTGLLQSITKE